MRRVVLGRLLRFGVRTRRVRAAGNCLMRLMRFRYMRLMASHGFMRFGQQPP